MSEKLQLGKYRHNKSKKEYNILGIAHHSETMEELVVYQGLYNSEELGDSPMFARPLEMFLENVELDGKIVPRFKFIKK